MRRILAVSLAQPMAVLGLTLAFAIAGAVAFWHLPTGARGARVDAAAPAGAAPGGRLMRDGIR